MKTKPITRKTCCWVSQLSEFRDNPFRHSSEWSALDLGFRIVSEEKNENQGQGRELSDSSNKKNEICCEGE